MYSLTHALGWRHGGKGAVSGNGVLALPLRGPLVPVGVNGILQSSVIVPRPREPKQVSEYSVAFWASESEGWSRT